MRAFVAFVLGILLGAGGLWYYSTHVGRSGAPLGEQLQETAKSAGSALETKLRALALGTNDIKNEVARTGVVVRRKATEAGHAVADATADARITASIKAKLLATPDLSALSISVNTTEGVVTLSGSVPSNESLGKAILVAWETDGVRQVISTLQVKK